MNQSKELPQSNPVTATNKPKKVKKKIVLKRVALKDLDNVVGGLLPQRTSWTNGCN